MERTHVNCISSIVRRNCNFLFLDLLNGDYLGISLMHCVSVVGKGTIAKVQNLYWFMQFK